MNHKIEGFWKGQHRRWEMPRGEQKAMKSSVCDTCVKPVLREFFAYREPRKTNKLRVINTTEYSDSPRLQDSAQRDFVP
ncbi:MAG: hypothetical protein LAN62_09525 [Acidobacteriia bacterium]|nr:hypothetical protein [Terriglobia bacterium]